MYIYQTLARGLKVIFPRKLGWSAGGLALAAALTLPMPLRANVTQAPAPSTASAVTAAAADDSAELRVGLPGAQLAGSAKLTVWGFDVYKASLWVAPGFRQSAYSQHAFALELAYLRKFEGSAITERTLAEMQRQAKVPAEKARAWREAMLAIFPSVKPGDRITGIHQPGAGTRFLVNGKPKGEIVDPEFDRLFFGIWLSDATSEPALRQALLAQTAR
jgi:Chalcone isomerase-like